MIAHEELVKFVDYNEQTGFFTWLIWLGSRIHIGDRAGSLDPNGYRYIQIKRKKYLEQRLAVFYMTGKWPKYQVDHINGIKNDNRWCNLREATHPQNKWNRGKYTNNSSGHKGVSWCKREEKWRTDIQVNNRRIFLGYFDTLEDARNAYCKAAIKYHKQFARVA